MQFFFGWIAGVLTAGVAFIVWWLEQSAEGKPEDGWMPDQDDVNP